jgi:hypothetical protein
MCNPVAHPCPSFDRLFGLGRSTPSLASLPSPHIPVRSFGRFDEITYLVENSSCLTLHASRLTRGVVGANQIQLCSTGSGRSAPCFAQLLYIEIAFRPVVRVGNITPSLASLPSRYIPVPSLGGSEATLSRLGNASRLAHPLGLGRSIIGIPRRQGLLGGRLSLLNSSVRRGFRATYWQ